jgi:acetylornithine/N-succinyldiaminopimelate aminotransferase
LNLFSLRRSPPSLDDLVMDASLPTQGSNLSSEYLMPSVERPKQVFVRGQGSWFWSTQSPPRRNR